MKLIDRLDAFLAVAPYSPRDSEDLRKFIVVHGDSISKALRAAEAWLEGDDANNGGDIVVCIDPDCKMCPRREAFRQALADLEREG